MMTGFTKQTTLHEYYIRALSNSCMGWSERTSRISEYHKYVIKARQAKLSQTYVPHCGQKCLFEVFPEAALAL